MTEAAMSKCVVPNCAAAPTPILCGEHWPLVTGDVRRELVQEFKRMTDGKQKNLGIRLRQLLEIAVRQASK
jgi:hypothetical protein